MLCLASIKKCVTKQPHPQEVAKEFASRVLSVNVYVIEAHACDEWALPENAECGLGALAQPVTRAQRLDAAAEFVRRFDPKMPTLVDDVTDAVELAYEARPERLYVIDPAGPFSLCVCFPCFIC